ncbi:glycosyltransferase family protein [Nafulsella turpanensis]|uniref:glycosyltransferase n=1 Tax=Nafulsella turpanensis TaxID=1265690 RepID=UPI0003473540|nr:glycosyltransferase [Nafulsella turpanensis]
MKNYAPILLFTYKRLDTLKKTISALQKNYLANESELFIFSDGPKSEKDQMQVNEVRAFLVNVNGFKNVKVKEAQSNKGLANSIITGVTEVLESFDKVIVLEDDLLTTPNFLNFMNKSLVQFENISLVFSISGYSFNLGKSSLDSADAYFLSRGWSWGWATWKNRWGEVDWQVKDYENFKSDKRRQKEFAQGGSDLNKMLRHQMEGKLDSWAIRWFYHQFIKGGLTLYPVHSKVYNNGFDAYATHTNGSDKRYRPFLDVEHADAFLFPDLVEKHPFYQMKFQQKMGIRARLKSKIESIVLKYF